MQPQMLRPLAARPLVVAAVLLAAPAADAGPRGVCHPIHASAESLPWRAVPGWDGRRPDYPRGELLADTLGLLEAQPSALARMETLRRATIYASEDGVLARKLAAQLGARAFQAEAAGRSAAPAWFDAGYAVELLRQARHLFERHGTELPAVVGTCDGQLWLDRALDLSEGDAEMALGAALVTAYPRKPGHARYLALAWKGAATNPALERNLEAHFERAGPGPLRRVGRSLGVEW